LSKGGLRDGFSYVYPLWRSLLARWLQEEGAKVFVAAPSFDPARLADVTKLLLMAHPKSNLQWVYASAGTTPLKASILCEFALSAHAYVEHFLFNRILYPVKRMQCTFFACVHQSQATVVVTSAHLNKQGIGRHGNQSVTLLEMSEEEFHLRFIQPNEQCS
jgi:hypothetical protein